MKKRMMMTLLAAVMCATNLMAQQTKVDDKELVGVWLMESMQYEGERKIECGKASNYTQVKVYRANGEYACAEIVRNKDGQCRVLPHEYGTYTFKNGVYTEMGREPSVLVLTDKTHFKGRWMNRHDLWKKATNMPEKLTQYIVDRCKENQGPGPDIQKLIVQYMF